MLDENSKEYMRLYSKMNDKHLEELEKIVFAKRRRWHRIHLRHFADVIADKATFKSFVKWADANQERLDLFPESTSYSSEESSLDASEVSENLEQFMHSRSYWYDATEDKYVVQLKSKNRPMILTGAFWRSIKSSYSNWSGKGSSINEICRKFELTRATLVELLRMMGVTHDSSPFSDENVLESTESELIEQLIRQKEENILLESKRREYRQMKKYSAIYRNHKLYAEEMNLLIHENIGKGLDRRRVFKYKLDGECSSNVLLVSPTDFHWGKYAGSHTGDAYNRQIAEDRLFDCTNRLMSRVLRTGKPSRIIVGLGGDGLHIDNIQKKTTRGTDQDVDGSPIEIVHSYIDLCRRYVLYLNKFCDVDVYVVNGNHDFYSSIFLRASLSACFASYEGIKVITDLGVRQTFLYGNSLITFVHGDDGSVKDYPAIIASENAALWGKSKWRYIFTGHFHTERELPTFGDTVVHRMPSLAGTDDWHHKKGYKSRKSLIGYIIDEEEGLITKEIIGV